MFFIIINKLYNWILLYEPGANGLADCTFCPVAYTTRIMARQGHVVSRYLYAVWPPD